MLYQVEYHPNPNCMSIHVSKRLTDDCIELFDGKNWNKKKQPRLVLELFDIEGIVSVSLHQYEMTIIKGRVFDWDNLIQQIIPVIQAQLAPDETVFEKVKPYIKTPQYDEEECSDDEEY